MLIKKGNNRSITRDSITSRINMIGPVELGINETSRIIEDIIGWYLSENEIDNRTNEPDSLDDLVDMLATVSDIELCYLWETTVGEFLFNSLSSDETINDKEQWIQQKIENIRRGIIHKWTSTIEIGTARIIKIREEKNELIETIYESTYSYRRAESDTPLGEFIIRPLLEFVDSLTLCVFWNYLCHTKINNKTIVPDNLQRLDDDDTSKTIRGMIWDINGDLIHSPEFEFDMVFPLLRNFMPITKIKEFWNLDYPDNKWNQKIANPYYRERKRLTQEEIQDYMTQLRRKRERKLRMDRPEKSVDEIRKEIKIKKDILANLKTEYKGLNETQDRESFISALEYEIRQLEDSLQNNEVGAGWRIFDLSNNKEDQE